MGVGKELEWRSHIIGFREEIESAARQSDQAFFTWFDGAETKDAAFLRGSWDFMFHIAAPLAHYLGHPQDKVALEIGYGGGRLLAAASRYFRDVIGVDIHAQDAKVREALAEQGVRNIRLFRTEGVALPCQQASVDCVYSFIVLQHVERYDIFVQYFREAYRVLKPGGVAVLYFGRKPFLSFNASSRWRYLADRCLERVRLRGGYQELPARVNATNLLVSLSHAKRLSRTIGFEVLEGLVSRRRIPDGTHLYGGQHGLVLRKPGLCGGRTGSPA